MSCTFEQGVRELYKLNVQFLTFFYEVLVQFFLMHHRVLKSRWHHWSLYSNWGHLLNSAVPWWQGTEYCRAGDIVGLCVAVEVTCSTVLAVVLVTVQDCSCVWFYRFFEWFCCRLSILSMLVFDIFLLCNDIFQQKVCASSSSQGRSILTCIL